MRAQRIAVALTLVNLLVLLVTVAQPRARVLPTSRQAATPVLRGQAVELVDARGQVRSTLKIEPDGQVVFRLLGQDGTIRVKLGAATGGSGLVLLNDATEPGVHIIAGVSGTSLKLRNKDGHERIFTP